MDEYAGPAAIAVAFVQVRLKKEQYNYSLLFFFFKAR